MEYVDLELAITIENPFLLSSKFSSQFDLPDSEALIRRLFENPHVAPVVWGERRYRFRSLDANDYDAIVLAISGNQRIFELYVAPVVFGDGNYEVDDSKIVDISISCIKIKWKKVVSATTVFLAINTIYVDHIRSEPTPIDISCRVSVTSPRAIAYHIEKIAQHSPSVLFSNESDCIKLKQRALSVLGYYNGRIDGIYGNKTSDGEYNYAIENRINPKNTDEIYEDIARQIQLRQLGKYRNVL